VRSGGKKRISNNIVRRENGEEGKPSKNAGVWVGRGGKTFLTRDACVKRNKKPQWEGVFLSQPEANRRKEPGKKNIKRSKGWASTPSRGHLCGGKLKVEGKTTRPRGPVTGFSKHF